MTIKKFVIGILIFVFTLLFIFYGNKAINPEPEYKTCSNYYYDMPATNSKIMPNSYSSNCNSNYDQLRKDYRKKEFFIVMVLSLLSIIAGVAVRTVAPISWGLISAGLIAIIYILSANFEVVDKPYRAIISGAALAVLIWLAYAKLGDKEKLEPQTTISGTNATA